MRALTPLPPPFAAGAGGLAAGAGADEGGEGEARAATRRGGGADTPADQPGADPAQRATPQHTRIFTTPSSELDTREYWDYPRSLLYPRGLIIVLGVIP